MSSGNSLTPTGELGAWRVIEPPPVDYASVERSYGAKSIIWLRPDRHLM